MSVPPVRPTPSQPSPRLRLLGGAGIQSGTSPVAGPASQRHRLALLALLSVAGGRPVTRDKLMAFLWPDRDTDHARNLLKVSVHEIRKALGDGALKTIGDQLSLDTTVVSSDVGDFLAALERGDDEGAVAAYAGPLLDGFFIKDALEFERWTDSERTRLSGMYGSALERLSSRARERGDRDAAVRWSRALAGHDPHRADFALRFMEALVAAGDAPGAIRHADFHAAQRRSEFGVEPDDAVASFAARLMDDAKSPPTPGSRRSGSLRSAFAPYSPALPPTTAEFPVALRAPTQKWRWILLAAGIAIALAIIAVTIRPVITHSSASPAGAGPTVAVFPFRAVGSDSTGIGLRNGIVDALAARFTGEGGPQAIDPTTAFAAWHALSPNGAEVPLDAALAAARKLNASSVLLGQALTIGGNFELTATLYRSSDGAVVVRATVEVPTPDRLTASVDRLAAEILARLAREPDDRLSDLATRPIGALRTYLAASAEYRAGRYAHAESLYARALDADSTFPLAGLGLAMANSWTVINDHYGRGRDVAYRWRANLSLRDRSFLDAFFGSDPGLGPPKPAPVYLKQWEGVVEAWPDWAEAWYELGDRYYHFGGLSGLSDPSDRARNAFRRSLEIEPGFTAPLHHLVEIYAADGERDELIRVSNLYFAANPSVSRDGSAIGWEVATALADEPWLSRSRAHFATMGPSDLTRIVWVTEVNGWALADGVRALDALERQASVTSAREQALILRYTVALNRGDAAAARGASASIGGLFPDRPAGSLLDMYAALFGSDVRNARLADSSASELAPFAASAISGDHVRRDHHHQAVCLVGYWRALNGDVRASGRALDALRAELAADHDGDHRAGDVCAAWLDATLAVAQHATDARGRVARLDTVLLSNRVPPHMVLEAGTIVSSRLHEALGQLPDALVAARQREHLTGAPTFLSTELSIEARLSAALDDRAGADHARRLYDALRKP